MSGIFRRTMIVAGAMTALWPSALLVGNVVLLRIAWPRMRATLGFKPGADW